MQIHSVTAHTNEMEDWGRMTTSVANPHPLVSEAATQLMSAIAMHIWRIRRMSLVTHIFLGETWGGGGSTTAVILAMLVSLTKERRANLS